MVINFINYSGPSFFDIYNCTYKEFLRDCYQRGGIDMFLFMLGLFIGSLAGMMLMAMLVSSRNIDDIKYRT